MIADEGHFQWFQGRRGNGQRSTVAFNSQQDFVVLVEASGGGEHGLYVTVFVVNIFSEASSLQGHIFE